MPQECETWLIPETPISQIQHQFNYCPCSYIVESWVVEEQQLKLQAGEDMSCHQSVVY
ncbi:SctK family type III secretion system sorting platform protein [Vibrio cyclitrophicus]